MPSANGKVTGVNGKITLSKVPRWQQGVFACDITPHVSFRLSVSLRGQARKTTGIPGRSERLYQAALLRLTSLARGDGDPTRRHYDIQQRDQLRQHFISTQALFANGRINGGQKPARLGQRLSQLPHNESRFSPARQCRDAQPGDLRGFITSARLRPPRSWETSGLHSITTLRSPWYQAMFVLQNTFYHSCVRFFQDHMSYDYVFAPLTTDCISSPRVSGPTRCRCRSLSMVKRPIWPTVHAAHKARVPKPILRQSLVLRRGT
jgi:hypothetical protein